MPEVKVATCGIFPENLVFSVDVLGSEGLPVGVNPIVNLLAVDFNSRGWIASRLGKVELTRIFEKGGVALGFDWGLGDARIADDVIAIGIELKQGFLDLGLRAVQCPLSFGIFPVPIVV